MIENPEPRTSFGVPNLSMHPLRSRKEQMILYVWLIERDYRQWVNTRCASLGEPPVPT
jgi:hypothetical protein